MGRKLHFSVRVKEVLNYAVKNIEQYMSLIPASYLQRGVIYPALKEELVKVVINGTNY